MHHIHWCLDWTGGQRRGETESAVLALKDSKFSVGSETLELRSASETSKRCFFFPEVCTDEEACQMILRDDEI